LRCDVAIASGDALAPELAALTTFTPCTAASASSDNHLKLGDRVDLVIDYGGLELSDGTAAPSPTITTTIDGVATPLGVGITPQAKLAGRAFFETTFVTPQRPHTTLTVLVQAATDFTHAVPLSFLIDDADVRVSIDGCDALECTALAGGQATARISVAGQTMQVATLHALLDLDAQLGPPPSHTEVAVRSVAITQPAPGNRLEAAAPFDLPLAVAGARWSLSVEVGAQTVPSPSLKLGEPALALSVEQCPADGTSCKLTAGVDRATVHLSAVGAPQTVLLRQLINDNPQPNPTPVRLDVPAGNGFTQLAFVDVPALAVGTRWSLRAELGPFARALAQPITLAAPMITAALTCGPGCQPPAGATVPIVVTAPLALRDLSTAITATAPNGGATVVTAPTALTIPDNASQTISGIVLVPLPGLPGQTVTIDAVVGGYHATTLSVTLAPSINPHRPSAALPPGGKPRPST
jgi:hypothetical protein